MDSIRDWPFQRIVKRFLLIAILFYLLYAAVDMLYVTLLPLQSHEDLHDHVPKVSNFEPTISRGEEFWSELLGYAETDIISRSISVLAASSKIDFAFAVIVANTHPFASEATSWEFQENLGSFVEFVFGEVEVEGRPLSGNDFSPHNWTIDSETQTVTIDIAASVDISDHPWVYITRWEHMAAELNPEIDVFVLELDGYRTRRFSPLPNEANDNRFVIQGDSSDVMNYISFSLEPGPIVIDAESTGKSQITRQEFLWKVNSILENPLVTSSLFSIIEALPLLIFIWIIMEREHIYPQFAVTLASIIGGLLVFHFVLYFNVGNNLLVYRSTLIRSLSDELFSALAPFYRPRIRPILGNGVGWVGMVMLGVIIPAFLIQRAKPHHSTRSHTVRAVILRGIGALTLLLGGVSAILIVSIYTSAIPFGDRFPLWQLALPIACLISWAAYGILYLVYRLMTFSRPRPGVILLAVWLLILVAAIPGFTMQDQYESWEPYMWWVITVALGTALIYAIGYTTWQLWKEIKPGSYLKRWQKGLIYIIMIALAIPMGHLIDTTRSIAYSSDVVGLAYRLDDLIELVWLIGGVWLLYNEGRSGAKLDEFIRLLGILVASRLLFSPTTWWLYIPIPFLLGYFLLSHFVRPTDYWEEYLQPFYSRVVEKRPELLDQIINFNTAEDAYQTFRKKKAEKLSEGEITFDEYDTKIKERRQRLDALHQAAEIEGQSVKKLALTFGPHTSAWDNGWHGAKWALLFAIPWIVLFLLDFFAESVPRQTYPLFGFFESLVFVIARWGVIGFVFGYFYPYLRGNNGLQKGLGLFLIIVLPMLPIAALNNSSIEGWQGTLFWVLQVFIQCLLLGLMAFDFMILKDGYHDWKMLFEVHGMTSVGASVSTLVAAIVTALVTLWSSQAANLINVALKFVTAPIPPDMLPKP